MQPVLLLAYTFVGATGGFRGQLVGVLTDGLVEHGPLAALTSVRRLTSVRAALLPRLERSQVRANLDYCTVYFTIFSTRIEGKTWPVFNLLFFLLATYTWAVFTQRKRFEGSAQR